LDFLPLAVKGSPGGNELSEIKSVTGSPDPGRLCAIIKDLEIIMELMALTVIIFKLCVGGAHAGDKVETTIVKKI